MDLELGEQSSRTSLLPQPSKPPAHRGPGPPPCPARCLNADRLPPSPQHGTCPSCRHPFADLTPPSDSDAESSDGGEYLPGAEDEDEDVDIWDDHDFSSEIDTDYEIDLSLELEDEMDALDGDGDGGSSCAGVYDDEDGESMEESTDA